MVEKLSVNQAGRLGRGWYIVFALIGAIILVQAALLMMLPNPATTRASDQVTLVGMPWNKPVQMFETLDIVDTPILEQFADGTICTKLSGPTKANGSSMNFYLLDCNGTSGYIDAQQVQE